MLWAVCTVAQFLLANIDEYKTSRPQRHQSNNMKSLLLSIHQSTKADCSQILYLYSGAILVAKTVSGCHFFMFDVALLSCPPDKRQTIHHAIAPKGACQFKSKASPSICQQDWVISESFFLMKNLVALGCNRIVVLVEERWRTGSITQKAVHKEATAKVK